MFRSSVEVQWCDGFGLKGNWGFVDKSGNWAITPMFNFVNGGFSQGLASV